MKQRAGALLPVSAAISVAVNAMLLFLVPYHPLQPRQPSARLMIPVRLIHVQPFTEHARVAERVVRRVAPEAAEERIRPPAILELPAEMQAPPSMEAPRAEETPIAEAARPSGAPEAESPAVTPAPVDEGAAAAAQASVEIAAYQAILSSFRGRIVREIRYPVIARSSGWGGTVVLAVRLDAAGNLVQSIVRRSSGYEVLDRAATALIRKVTPVANPLCLPVTIDIPIVYELK
jgi:periplasmic protein TonB